MCVLQKYSSCDYFCICRSVWRISKCITIPRPCFLVSLINHLILKCIWLKMPKPRTIPVPLKNKHFYKAICMKFLISLWRSLPSIFSFSLQNYSLGKLAFQKFLRDNQNLWNLSLLLHFEKKISFLKRYFNILKVLLQDYGWSTYQRTWTLNFGIILLGLPSRMQRVHTSMFNGCFKWIDHFRALALLKNELNGLSHWISL